MLLIKILFVGTFQSGRHQTKDVAESIALHLQQDGLQTDLTSYKANKILRLLDILIRILFYPGQFIHINTFSDQAFMMAEWGSKLAAWRGKSILLTLHGGKLNEFEQSNPKRVKKVFSRATQLLTPSLFLQKYFTQKGYHLQYIPNPLSLDKFPFKSGREIGSEYKLLWVRAFGEIYQPDLAVRTLYEVKKSWPNATLTMIGPDKGLMNETKELANQLNLQNDIYFPGPIPNEKLAQIYQSHHCYINTPKYESFGVALMEAASCGIPIVSVSVGEIPYLWKHDVSMRIVSEHNPERMAAQILLLAQNQDLAARQALRAKEVAEQFEWERIKPYWHKVLGLSN
jgi:glycosyltransferase involved in cell wall biosynthesis